MPQDKTIIHLTKDSKGVLSCDVPITKEQWLDILRNRTVTTAQYLKVLLSFYFMPDHRATCAQCEKEYGLPSGTYNVCISHFGKAVSKLFDDFEIVDDTADSPRLWPIPMGKGKTIIVDGSPQFEWQLRKELVEALEVIVIENAISKYMADFEVHWDNEKYNEKYKWQAIKFFQNNWDIDAPDFAAMLEKALGKTKNLLDSGRTFPRGVLLLFAKEAPETVRSMFAKLYDESLDLKERISDFINSAQLLKEQYLPDPNKSHYQNANAVSVYLWLRYPDKYYIYKYNVYKDVDEKLNFGLDFKTGKISQVIKGYKMYNLMNEVLISNHANTDFIAKHFAEDSSVYPDPKFITATIDLGYYISRWMKSPKEALKSLSVSHMNPFIQKAKSILENKKNIILQGAPGTGKTYNTASLALSIIDGKVPETHDEVMARYSELCDERRIGFATFHQSMDYEDFIEGIKPDHAGENIIYKVEDGIFKQMCLSAKTASEVAASGTEDLLAGLNENPTIWKVSLEGTGDNPTRRDCMENGHIRIGWAEYGDIDFTEDNPKVGDGKYVLRRFQNEMKIGDIVVSCWSANETDAIGIITGDYEYRSEGGQLPRYRDVKWIVKGIKHDIRSINNNHGMVQASVYRLSTSLNDIIDVIKHYAPGQQTVVDNIEKPYVLIIDEINRGNVSKVFGELITLIEKDKRTGAEHPITVTLPYSKKPFGVPENLYIIGTMNTTDRSTGTIDYALRRRFAFLTVPSEKKHIESETGKKLFDSVKEFIEKFRFADIDVEDLMVGHSYFMAEDDEDLKLKVQYEIIPLIKEYIKDGILRVNPAEQKKYFDAWLELETLDDNDSGTSED